MSRTLKEFYPPLVVLALALSLFSDGAVFIMVMAAAIAALPLAYAQDAEEIARQVRAREAGSPGNAITAGNADDGRDAPG